MEIFSAYSRADREGLLRKLAETLGEKGYVRDTYAASLLAREEMHPTGLMVENLINIAIPHTDMEHVLQPTMVVIKNSGPRFHFCRMDDPTQEIPVDVVFLLVVKESDGYVSFLAALTNLFQDQAFIELLTRESPQSICQELAMRLPEYQLDYQGDLLPV